MLPHKGHLTKVYYENFLDEFFGYFQYFQTKSEILINLKILFNMILFYPDIDWKKYYPIILPTLMKILLSAFQKKKIIRYQSTTFNHHTIFKSLIKGNRIHIVAKILANLIRTSDIEGS